MQIIGFSVRLSSSLLWMQMYRLGASYMDNSVHRDTDVDLRNSFLSPTTPLIRRPSGSDDVIGGSIYDPAYYSSLFEDGRENAVLCEVSSHHPNYTLPLLGYLSPCVLMSHEANMHYVGQHYLKSL